MNVKLLTNNHLEFLSLKGGCTGSSESTLVKTPHCWKSHVLAHLTIRSLYRHVVRNVPVSCKANRDRNQLGVWLDSDLIVE